MIYKTFDKTSNFAINFSTTNLLERYLNIIF